MCVSCAAAFKLTKWKTSTTNNNKMRQEDSNIENTEQKGKTQYQKPQYQPKSSSQSQMHSQKCFYFGIVTRKIALRHDSSGVGLYFGCQNIPSKAK